MYNSSRLFIIIPVLLIIFACSKEEPLIDTDKEIIEEENGNNTPEETANPYDGKLLNKISLQYFEANGNSAVFDGEKWIVVGNDIYVSTDETATEWLKVNTAFDSYYYKILWNGEVLVAVGTDRIISSTDGKSWTTTLSQNYSNQKKDIVWSGEYFIVTTYFNGVLRSKDGSNWEAIKNTPNLNQIVNYKGKLIGLETDGNYVFISDDHGLTWSESNRIQNASGRIREIVVATDALYAFDFDKVLVSNDGINWISKDRQGINHDFTIFHEGKFYSVVQRASTGSVTVDLSAIIVSNDGINWQQTNSGTHSPIVQIVASPSKMLAVGNDILWSTNGEEWKTTVPRTFNFIKSVNWSNERAVFTGNDGGFLTSTDLKYFDLQNYEQFGTGYNSGIFLNDKFYFVGRGGTIISSELNSNPTSVFSSTNKDLYSIAHNSLGFLVAVGNEGTIVYSQNGIDWSNASLDKDIRMTKVKVINDIFFICAEDGIYSSKDGISWDYLNLNPDEKFSTAIRDLEFGNNTFVAIADSRYFISNDVETWTAINYEGYNEEFIDIEFTGEEFIALTEKGLSNTIDASFDGINWTQVFSDAPNVNDNNRASSFAWNGKDIIITGTFESPVIIARVAD